ncbi:MAG: TRAP transporter large permease [Planctomycetota bacterium]|jgi:tripartite ATP-independent transporter DctM subunit|nr:TRAP transporter large permease [Planctomycetota bacterium]
MNIALTVMVLLFGGLAVIGVPLSFSTGIAAMAYFIISDQSLRTMAHQFFTSINSFVLLAVPLFIMTGHIMAECKITDRIIDLANLMVGRFRGGLAQVNILASMMFGGCSGSALADVAGLGSVLIPAMRKNGYSAGFSTAVTVASSIQGPIIPPSIPIVIFASVTQLSTGALLVGGAVPGILLGAIQMIATYFIARRRNYLSHDVVSGYEAVMRILIGSIPAVIMPGILMGGIISGVFTPTEAAAVAVAYALLLGLVVYRNLSFRALIRIGTRVARDTASIFLLIGTAGIFGWILAVTHLPQELAGFISKADMPPALLLLVINVILLFWGMLMDAAPAILILGPILTPIAVRAGVQPVHFGVIMVFNLMLGLMTPPYGLCLFAGAAIAKIPIGEVVRELLPYIFVSVAMLLIVTYVPALVLTVPRLVGLL